MPGSLTAVCIRCPGVCVECGRPTLYYLNVTREFVNDICEKYDFQDHDSKYRSGAALSKYWTSVRLREMFSKANPGLSEVELLSRVRAYYALGTSDLHKTVLRAYSSGWRLADWFSIGVRFVSSIAATVIGENAINLAPVLLGGGELVTKLAASRKAKFAVFALAAGPFVSAFTKLAWQTYTEKCFATVSIKIGSDEEAPECQELAKSPGDAEGASLPVVPSRVSNLDAEGNLLGETKGPPTVHNTCKLEPRVPDPGDQRYGKIQARLIGLPSSKITCFANNSSNLAGAVSSRVFKDAAQRQISITRREKVRLGRAVSGLVKNVFSPARIRECAGSKAEVDFLPKSWSAARTLRARAEALRPGRKDPRRADIFVKGNEALPKSKFARLIVNPGPGEQFDAGPLIGLIEDVVMSSPLANFSIKHKDKDSAFQVIVSAWKSGKYGFAYENDFSSFEYSISNFIVNNIEKPIYAAIYSAIKDDLLEADIDRAFLALEREKEFLNFVSVKNGEPDKLRVILDFVVRWSGYRGTSIMNFLVNLVLFVVSMEDPALVPAIFSSRSKINTDGSVTTENGEYCFRFEGDDGLIMVDTKKDLSPFFHRMGFLAKMVEIDRGGLGRLEFCGWHVFFNGDDTFYGPDAIRALTNSNYTFSDCELNSVAFASFAARALDNASNHDLFQYFYAWAVIWYRKGVATIEDRNLAVQFSLAATGSVTDCHIIVPKNVMERLDEVRGVVTPNAMADGYMRFCGLEICRHFSLDHATLISSIPPSWREILE